MENHETLQGILALIDIVNFTGQSSHLAEKYTAQYSQFFQEKIDSIVNQHGFRAIKFLGDAALIFGSIRLISWRSCWTSSNRTTQAI